MPARSDAQGKFVAAQGVGRAPASFAADVQSVHRAHCRTCGASSSCGAGSSCSAVYGAATMCLDAMELVASLQHLRFCFWWECGFVCSAGISSIELHGSSGGKNSRVAAHPRHLFLTPGHHHLLLLLLLLLLL